MNAVERKPVETRVLNPTASEVSYKPKQRSYRTTNLKEKVLAPNCPGAEMSRRRNVRRRIVQCRNVGAESAAPSQRRRNVPDPRFVAWRNSAFNLLFFFCLPTIT